METGRRIVAEMAGARCEKLEVRRVLVYMYRRSKISWEACIHKVVTGVM